MDGWMEENLFMAYELVSLQLYRQLAPSHTVKCDEATNMQQADAERQTAKSPKSSKRLQAALTHQSYAGEWRVSKTRSG